MLQKSYSDDYTNKAAKGINKTDPKEQPIVGAFIQLFHFIVGAGAVPVRLLRRKNFGERSITSTSWAVSLGLHLWYIYGYAAIFIGFGALTFFRLKPPESLNYFDFFLIFLITFLNPFNFYLRQVFYTKAKLHFKAVIKKAQDNRINESSYYRGDAIYHTDYLGKEIKTILGKFTVDEEILRMIVEPRKTLYAGLLITLCSALLSFIIAFATNNFYVNCLAIYIFSFSAVGIMIALSSFCLFLEELGLYLRKRNAALDILDGERDLKAIMETKGKLLGVNGENNKTNLKEEFPTVEIY